MDNNTNEKKKEQVKVDANEDQPEGMKIIAPLQCPFSGVSIDPKVWESFQAKMKAKNERDSDDSEEENDDMFGDLLKIAQRHGIHPTSASPLSAAKDDDMPPIPNIHTIDITADNESSKSPEHKTLRIKIVNSLTQRSKDLLVDISDETTLWDGVYNLRQVKDAHVRKWNSEIAQKVKANKAEIQLQVWDENVQQPWHCYQLDELKENTTRQFYEKVVPTADNVVVVKLVVVDKETATDTSS